MVELQAGLYSSSTDHTNLSVALNKSQDVRLDQNNSSVQVEGNVVRGGRY